MNPSTSFKIYPPVFYPSCLIIAAFMAAALFQPQQLEAFLVSTHNWIADYFGWLIILSANFFVFFCLYCAFSRFGEIKIGGADAQTEFSFGAWFAMLFTAGLGSDVLFFGVSEPISHYLNPPIELSNSAEKAAYAMQLALLHFGIHGWAVYLIVGLAVAFFTFNHGLPLTISATFYPLLKDKIYSVWGNIIDVATVLSNLFGVVLSLTIAAQLLSSGLNRLVGLPDTLALQLAIMAFITIAATISVVSGLNNGIKLLSYLNIRLAILLLLVMLCLGPTVFILDGFVQNLGLYFQNIIQLGTWTEAYQAQNWQNAWTLFYWVWWMAYAPFVGIFIARISKGRTIRQFILMGLLPPCLLMIAWFAVFGGAALHLEMQEGLSLATSVKENAASVFFDMLNYYPFPFFTSCAFFILALLFFITSSDSASLVNDIVTSGGQLETTKTQRIFWAITEGIIGAIFLSFGGLGVINGAITIFGFLFMLIIWGMCWSLYKGLKAASTKQS